MELRVGGTQADIIKTFGRNSQLPCRNQRRPRPSRKGSSKAMVSSMEVLKDFNFAAYCPLATDGELCWW